MQQKVNPIYHHLRSSHGLFFISVLWCKQTYVTVSLIDFSILQLVQKQRRRFGQGITPTSLKKLIRQTAMKKKKTYPSSYQFIKGKVW